MARFMMAAVFTAALLPAADYKLKVLRILTRTSSRPIVGVHTSLSTNFPPHSSNLTAFMRTLL